MRYIKWLGLAAAVILILSCFSPWVVIESKNIVISGVASAGTTFGKPGYLHIFFALLFILFLLPNKLWAYRTNVLIATFNMGWALRNIIILPACEGGECPQKQWALYVVVLASFGILIVSFFGGKLNDPIIENDEDSYDADPVKKEVDS